MLLTTNTPQLCLAMWKAGLSRAIHLSDVFCPISFSPQAGTYSVEQIRINTHNFQKRFAEKFWKKASRLGIRSVWCFFFVPLIRNVVFLFILNIWLLVKPNGYFRIMLCHSHKFEIYTNGQHSIYVSSEPVFMNHEFLKRHEHRSKLWHMEKGWQ